MKNSDQSARWLWLFLGAGILLYVGYTLVPMIYCHYSGKEAVAVVTATKKKAEGGLGAEPSSRAFFCTMKFDGHTVQKRTSILRMEGDRFPVIYLASNPSLLVRGTRADGLWNTLEKSTNEKRMLVALTLGFFFLLCAAKAPPRKDA